MTDPSPEDMLASIGRALYGEQWMAPLCAELKVKPRTMRRWMASSKDNLGPYHGVFTDCLKLLIARRNTLHGTAEHLRAWLYTKCGS